MPERHVPVVESPNADELQGAAGLPHQLDEPESSGGDQDIDTAGTEADEHSAVTARTDPNQDRQDRNVEEPGDTNSADIVGRTGEQMPQQSHDGLESDKRESPTRATDDNVDNVDDAPRTSRAS